MFFFFVCFFVVVVLFLFLIYLFIFFFFFFFVASVVRSVLNEKMVCAAGCLASRKYAYIILIPLNPLFI